MPRRVAHQLVRARGSWADEAHVSHKNAPELRQFIQAVLAEKSAERSHSWIVLDLEYRPTHLVKGGESLFALISVFDHRRELVSGETPPSVANNMPLIKYREVRRGDLDGDRNQQHYG